PVPMPERVPLLPASDGSAAGVVPAPQTVEIAGDYREAVWPLREIPRQRFTLGGDGTLELTEGKDFNWPDAPCTGLHVWIKPTGSALSHTETYPIVYRYLPREALAEGVGVVAAFEGPPPAPDAIVRLRPVAPP